MSDHERIHDAIQGTVPLVTFLFCVLFSSQTLSLMIFLLNVPPEVIKRIDLAEYGGFNRLVDRVWKSASAYFFAILACIIALAADIERARFPGYPWSVLTFLGIFVTSAIVRSWLVCRQLRKTMRDVCQ